MGGIALPSYAAGFAGRGLNDLPWAWDGLVAAWNPSLGATGKILRDLSGNGFHGTLIQDAHFALGPGGAILSLDGSTGGDKAEIVGAPVSNELNATVLVMLKTSVTPVSSGDAIYCERSSGTPIWKYDIVNGTTTHRFIHRDNANNLTSIIRGVVADGDWHIVGFTKAGTTIQMYIDGIPDGAPATLNGGDTLTVTSSAIGADNFDSTSRLNGEIGFVILYNRALNARQVKELYERQKQLVNV